MSRLPKGDRGIAVIAAVLTLVLLGVLVSGSLIVAARQARAGSSGLQAAAAFYAAEAGLSAALLDSSWARASVPASGLPVLVTSGELATGDSYEVRVTRLAAAAGASGSYFVLTSTGHAPGPRGGRRKVAMFVRSPSHSRWCCGAAATAGARVQVHGGGAIRANPDDPAAWTREPGLCGDSAASRPAVLARPGTVRAAEGAIIEGSPPVLWSEAGLENVLRELGSAFTELAGQAGIRLGGGAGLGGIGPALDGSGACDVGQSTNWGEPLDSTHPCFGHLPLVHVSGDLVIETSGRGQGILLVQGDLSLGGGFEFYGLVIVLGDLEIEAGRIIGAVFAPESSSVVRVGLGGELGLSECAAGRALRAAKLVLPHPLAQFSWLEILE